MFMLILSFQKEEAEKRKKEETEEKKKEKVPNH